jgi:hypothetical protein
MIRSRSARAGTDDGPARLRQTKLEAQQQSSQKPGTEECQKLPHNAEEIAPIDVNAFGRRLSEIIMQAVRVGQKKSQSRR